MYIMNTYFELTFSVKKTVLKDFVLQILQCK